MRWLFTCDSNAEDNLFDCVQVCMTSSCAVVELDFCHQISVLLFHLTGSSVYLLTPLMSFRKGMHVDHWTCIFSTRCV